VVNRVAGAAEPGGFPGVSTIFVPVVSPDPTGPVGLRAFGSAAHPLPPAGAVTPVREAGPRAWTRRHYRFPLDRSLYMVVGKGGAGKTTVASALGASVARSGRDTLLLSTDPAGSLGDVWGVPVRHDPVPAPGEPHLQLRQLDAGVAWSRYSEVHGSHLDEIASRLLASPGAAEAGPGVIRNLLEHAPPGIDELMALAELVDHAGAGASQALVLDTAPTGHLLRLLTTPTVVLQWTHALMRLLLRYRDVVGLGSASEEILGVARRVRLLHNRLRAEDGRFVMVVALPDELNAAEAERLLGRLEAEGIAADALLLNRALTGGSDLAISEASVLRWIGIAGDLPLVTVPLHERGPTGADGLHRFREGWRMLEPVPQ
jgi:arsenite/tail-anchored protein-transporting ATPase